MVNARIKAADGTQIHYINRIPSDPKGIVIILHGHRGHSGQYTDVANILVSNGFGVYAYDQRGHGQSGGERGYIDSFQDFVDDLAAVVRLAKLENRDRPIFTLGHSMGGFVSFAYGLKYPEMIKGQIFSAPALDSPYGTDLIPDWLYKGIKKLCPKLRIYPIISRKSTRNHDFIKCLKKDCNVNRYSTVKLVYEFLYEGIGWVKNNSHRYNKPCIFLHGKEDRIIPYTASVKIYNKISSKDKSLIIYNDLYHELMQEPEKHRVMNNIIQWLNKRV